MDIKKANRKNFTFFMSLEKQTDTDQQRNYIFSLIIEAKKVTGRSPSITGIEEETYRRSWLDRYSVGGSKNREKKKAHHQSCKSFSETLES